MPRPKNSQTKATQTAVVDHLTSLGFTPAPKVLIDAVVQKVSESLIEELATSLPSTDSPPALVKKIRGDGPIKTSYPAGMESGHTFALVKDQLEKVSYWPAPPAVVVPIVEWLENSNREAVKKLIPNLTKLGAFIARMDPDKSLAE